MKKASIVVLASVVLFSCDNDEDQASDFVPSSTFEVIQSQVFETNCVACHSAGTSFARQSDLVLTLDVAYENLIDREPANSSAAADGLLLVGTQGLPSLYSSFLWEKINAPDQEHFYEDHAEYGELMPLGLPVLTNGELEYIREWIVAGAPEDGFVADESLLENTSRFEVSDAPFEPLPIPERGVQLHLGPFEVQPNFEREIFQFTPVGNEEDIFVNQIDISMRRGSHHFIFYDFLPGTFLPQENVIRDLRNSNGDWNTQTLISMRDQVFVFGTQLRNTSYQYPEGVALRIPAGKGFDMNSHYVNYNSEALTGELYANFHAVDESEVQHLAENLFLNNDNFNLPANSETTLYADFTFTEARKIFLLSSHAHEKMLEFKIYINGGARDGELVYYTNDWEHPVLLDYDPPIELNAGEGLSSEATYFNNTNESVGFGLLSTDEMMIIFGSYYTD